MTSSCAGSVQALAHLARPCLAGGASKLGARRPSAGQTGGSGRRDKILEEAGPRRRSLTRRSSDRTVCDTAAPTVRLTSGRITALSRSTSRLQTGSPATRRMRTAVTGTGSAVAGTETG